MNRRQILKGGAAAVAAAGVQPAAGPAAAQGKAPIVIGQIGLSFHIAAAAVVARVLADHGHAVRFETALHEEMFARMARGEVDLLSSAWLPGSHGAYLAPFRDQVEALTVLYEPYALWGVPDYVPADAVAAVADLARPEVAGRMTRLIQGIGPGAGISRFSREIMDAYRLGDAGYEFRNGSQQDCEDAFTRAVAERRWVVVPLWHPQHLHHRYTIRELAEPKGLLRGRDAATLIARKDRLGAIDPAALLALSRIRLGNAAVAHLDYLISVEKKSPADAVDFWFAQNPETVKGWRAA